MILGAKKSWRSNCIITFIGNNGIIQLQEVENPVSLELDSQESAEKVLTGATFSNIEAVEKMAAGLP